MTAIYLGAFLSAVLILFFGVLYPFWCEWKDSVKEVVVKGDPEIIVEGSTDGENWETISVGHLDENDPDSYSFRNDDSYTYYRVTRGY